MKFDFSDRHVVVTGGTGALGRSVVEGVLEAGGRCHVPCHDSCELEDLDWAGHSSISVTEGVDLTRDDQVVAFYEALPSLWASIHCAGGFGMAPLAETGLDRLDHLWRLNAVSCFLCCREALKAFEKSPGAGGRIVNVAARPALEPREGAGMTAYTVTKSAVAALTVALAEEVAPLRIWVNAVAPSILDTAANREAMPDADFDSWPSTAEVAATMLFLASPGNRSTRGAVIACYGQV